MTKTSQIISKILANCLCVTKDKKFEKDYLRPALEEVAQVAKAEAAEELQEALDKVMDSPQYD